MLARLVEQGFSVSSDRTSHDRFSLSADREVRDAREARARETNRAASPERIRWTFGLSGWLASGISGGEDEFVLA
jgi:hypothetical protein